MRMLILDAEMAAAVAGSAADGAWLDPVPCADGTFALPAGVLVAPGGICAVFTDWRQLPITTDALQAAGWVWSGVVPWDKTERGRPQMGGYRAQAEYVVWGTTGARPLKGPTAPGVLRGAVPKRKHHIAGKPVELMASLMTIMDGPILDPFMGSGTVGIACLEASERYTGIEVDEACFEIARRRILEASAEGPRGPI